MSRWFALLLCFLVPNVVQASCPLLWPSGTFLQLYENDVERSADDWRAAAARWKKLGVEELILQWTAYGPPEGEGFALVEAGAVEKLLDAAHTSRIRVHLGLRYDPTFWLERGHDESAADPEAPQAPSALSRYLFERLRDQEALVSALAPLAGHPAFAGWYISDEIDDQRWRGAGRQALLTNYLKKTSDLVKRLTPHAPVTLSAFSNGLLPPRELAEFLWKLAQSSGIDRLLFQDGIGAHKLEISELPLYIPALREQFVEGGPTFAVIVEIFESGEAPDAFISAPMERITLQLRHAARADTAPFTFALPHHADALSEDAPLGLASQLLQLKRSCGS